MARATSTTPKTSLNQSTVATKVNPASDLFLVTLVDKPTKKRPTKTSIN